MESVTFFVHIFFAFYIVVLNQHSTLYHLDLKSSTLYHFNLKNLTEVGTKIYFGIREIA